MLLPLLLLLLLLAAYREVAYSYRGQWLVQGPEFESRGWVQRDSAFPLANNDPCSWNALEVVIRVRNSHNIERTVSFRFLTSRFWPSRLVRVFVETRIAERQILPTIWRKERCTNLGNFLPCEFDSNFKSKPFIGWKLASRDQLGNGAQ